MWRTVYLGLFSFFIFAACQSDPSQDQSASFAGTPADDYENNPHRWGFIDRRGKLVIDNRFDEVRAFSAGLALVRKNGYWGYINQEGKFAIPARLRAAWPFEHGVAKVQAADGKYGLIDPSGQWVAPPEWDELRPFSSGWASVRQGDQFGMIDTTGQLRLPLAYDGPGQRHGEQIIIRKNGKYGLVDAQGQEQLPFKFERLKPFQEGLARARINGLYGYLTPDGDWQIDPRYPQAGDFVRGLAPVLVDERWGLIDINGEMVVPPTYTQLLAAGADRWVAEAAEGYLLLDSDGQRLPAGPFVELHPFSEDLATFRDASEQWGYINPEGEVVIEPVYLLSWPFRNGQARVATRDGMTLINRNGKLIITPNPYLLELQAFSEGLAAVQVYK